MLRFIFINLFLFFFYCVLISFMYLTTMHCSVLELFGIFHTHSCFSFLIALFLPCHFVSLFRYLNCSLYLNIVQANSMQQRPNLYTNTRVVCRNPISDMFINYSKQTYFTLTMKRSDTDTVNWDFSILPRYGFLLKKYKWKKCEVRVTNLRYCIV